MNNKIAVFFLLIFFIAGCSSIPSQASPTISPKSTSNNGYPITAKTSNAAYPAQTVSSNGSASSATSDANLGTVKGVMLLKNVPVKDVTLYLARIIKDSQGRELAAGYERDSTLRSYSDQNGNFEIVNVPAGRYGLILDLVSTAYLLHDPGDQGSLIFTIDAGKTTDLGSLNYQELSGYSN